MLTLLLTPVIKQFQKKKNYLNFVWDDAIYVQNSSENPNYTNIYVIMKQKIKL